MFNRDYKPTKEDLLAAYSKTVPDVLAPGLKVLFCGINPGLYSAAIGHHFGRPGNRFWKAIYLAGFTPRLFSPYEDMLLLELGYGITNLAQRATNNAGELRRSEQELGAHLLVEKVNAACPARVAILGVQAYRTAFSQPNAEIGLQPDPLAGAECWVLPNPSGLNAHYQLEDLAREYKRLLA